MIRQSTAWILLLLFSFGNSGLVLAVHHCHMSENTQLTFNSDSEDPCHQIIQEEESCCKDEGPNFSEESFDNCSFTDELAFSSDECCDTAELGFKLDTEQASLPESENLIDLSKVIFIYLWDSFPALSGQELASEPTISPSPPPLFQNHILSFLALQSSFSGDNDSDNIG